MPNNQNKVRVGYHWCKRHSQKGGIEQYIVNITNRPSLSNYEFINCANPKSLSVPFLDRLFFLFDLLFSYFKIRSKKIDMYWGPAHKLPLFPIKDIPYVVTIHDLVWKTCPHTMPLGRRYVERFCVPIALRRADRIITVSKSTANDIVKHFPSYSSKIKIIPLGVMLNRNVKVAVSPEHTKKYILFVGTIEPRKNIHNMLKAYATAPKALREKYNFYIIGNAGWGKIKLYDIIQSLYLSPYVKWKSAINDQELIRYYQNAYCLLLPSFYEGFGLPIIEAQTFGVPVITSNLASMPEVVGKGGLLVDPNSVESIKNALQSLLDNDILRNSLSQKAKKNSSRFSWEKTRQETSLVFYEAMNLKKV